MAARRVAPRLLAIVVGLVCGILLTGTGRAQGPDDITGLLAEVKRLHGQGKYVEALPMAKRVVELAQKYVGEEQPEFAFAVTLSFPGERNKHKGTVRGEQIGDLWRIHFVDIFDIMQLLDAVHSGKLDTYYRKTITVRTLVKKG